MAIKSPFIAAGMIVPKKHREKPSELEVLARQLEDIEKDKYKKRKPSKSRKVVRRYEKATST